MKWSIPNKQDRPRHDDCKFAIADMLKEAKIEHTCEVYNLFAGYINQVPLLAGAAVDDDKEKRATQGLIPDFMYEKQRGQQTLADVKGIYVGNTRYGRARMADNQRCGAVAERQRILPNETKQAARAVDKKKNETPDGQVGPVERELNNFPEIEGLIFGAYGEVSQHVDDLMHTAADKAASVHWRSMGAPSQQNAKAMYVTRFREWLGIECVRSHAKLKADRLTEALAAAKNPPGGVKQAAERRKETAAAARLRRARYHAFHSGARTGMGRPW